MSTNNGKRNLWTKGYISQGAFVRNQKVDMPTRFPPIGKEGVLRVLRDVFNGMSYNYRAVGTAYLSPKCSNTDGQWPQGALIPFAGAFFLAFFD